MQSKTFEIFSIVGNRPIRGLFLATAAGVINAETALPANLICLNLLSEYDDYRPTRAHSKDTAGKRPRFYTGTQRPHQGLGRHYSERLEAAGRQKAAIPNAWRRVTDKPLHDRKTDKRKGTHQRGGKEENRQSSDQTHRSE